MFHGDVFLNDIQQTGARGTDKFFSTNWFMPISTWIEPEATKLDFSLRLEELMRIDGSGFAVCCDLNSVLVAVLFVVRVGSNLSRHDIPPA